MIARLTHLPLDIGETAARIPTMRGLPLVGFVVGGFSATAPPLSVRPSTGDVDYVLHPSQQNANPLVQHAIQQTAGNRRLNDDHWMNDDIATAITTSEYRDEIISQTIQQNVRLFESGKLILLAAWWDFQLSQKLNSICDLLDESSDREYYNKDLLDAAGFLHQINLRERNFMTESEAHDLDRFQLPSPHFTQAIQMVNEKYQQDYNAHGIITDDGHALAAPGPLPVSSDEESEGSSHRAGSPLDSIEHQEGAAAAHWGSNAQPAQNHHPDDIYYHDPHAAGWGWGGGYRGGRPPRRLTRRRTEDSAEPVGENL